MLRLLAPAYFLLCVLTLGVACNGGDDAGSAEDARSAATAVFGAGVDEGPTTAIAELLADPRTFDGQVVRVEGMITDVCPKRGCWIDLAARDAGDKLRVKVNDGEIVFPLELAGSRVVAQGTVVVEELSLEQVREQAAHHAEEMGEDFDPASISAGKTSVRIQGTGARVGG